VEAGFEAVWASRAASTALAPLGWLYAAGWTAYRWVYDAGIKRPHIPGIPSVCVGNLQAGGTGKTPFAASVVRMLAGAGRASVVSLSGYGAPRSVGATHAPEGPLDPAEWGDEPALFRGWLPGVPLVVGRDRVLAAEEAEERYPGSVLVLDDGHQHLRLRCRVRIVLDPPAQNRRCLPAGPYREPRAGGVARASLVLPSDRFAMERSLTYVSPDGTPVELPPVAQVLTAVARPGRIVEALEARGVRVTGVSAFPDHDPLDAPDLWRRIAGPHAVVTTAKDWVKLRSREPAPVPVIVADYTWAVEPEDEFRTWLLDRLDAPDS
jgi:tetraacyldisaccharide 4'-kinase